MRSNLALRTALAMALGCAANAQDAKSGERLTQDELLRQLDSFNPQTSDPLTKAPASVAQAGSRLHETVATTSAVATTEEAKAKKPKGVTEIESEAVEFDQKKHQAVFTGNVVVKDPEFDLKCDKLTAYLKNDKTGEAPAAPAPKKGDAPKNGDAAKKTGGLERAVAEGHVVIAQEKLDTDGKPTKSTGRAARADYDAATGEIVLSGNPEVEQGINTCVATDPTTKMYMKRDGKMRVDGPSKMMIRDQGGSK